LPLCSSTTMIRNTTVCTTLSSFQV
jgi:hypothetical protein